MGAFISQARLDLRVLPLGHLAFAYLLYVSAALANRHPRPTAWALLPLLIGSQLPDLIDKPLAYYGVLTYGRSFAHSIFTTILVCGFVGWIAHTIGGNWPADELPDRLRRHTPVAFTIGYASHLVGDTWHALAAGRIYDARFVLWPLYRMPASPADDMPPLTRMLQIYQEMETHPDLEVIVPAAVVFVGIRALELLRR